jgi:hypothetical protein
VSACSGQTSSKASSGYRQETGEDKDPIAILELGAATSWNLSGGAATFAPNLAAEVTPIENWLELEAGVSPFYTRNSTEWDTDLLFKKPWTISRKAEFMLGVGPQWVHLSQNGKVTNSIAGEVAGDFYVLANGQTPLRLAPRTGLLLQLCGRSPTIHGYERRSADWYSVIVTGHRNEVRPARCSVYPTELLLSSASRTLSFPEMRSCAGSYHLPVQHPIAP